MRYIISIISRRVKNALPCSKRKNDGKREIKKRRRRKKKEEENVRRKLKRPKSTSRVSTDNTGIGEEGKGRGFIIDVAWTGGMITRVCAPAIKSSARVVDRSRVPAFKMQIEI